ncbi:hypothetical protein M1N24_02675 [Dehalococcoidia bacterium]|nr:hypothetical protein [Dehalococcoidia bacterium]
MVAAYNRLNGLLVIGRRISFPIGGLLVIGAFIWFFASKERNIPDSSGGLNGNDQALLFVAGASAATIVVLLLSSLRNWSTPETPEGRGLDALRNSGYLRLVFRGAISRWKYWFMRTKRRSSG